MDPIPKEDRLMRRGKNKGIRERRPSPIRDLEIEALVMEAQIWKLVTTRP